jgi:hypothetical protein
MSPQRAVDTRQPDENTRVLLTLNAPRYPGSLDRDLTILACLTAEWRVLGIADIEGRDE